MRSASTAYAGAMIGEKLCVVRGEVTGLPMPAAAEIIVEGWIRPDRLLKEGPFGEWTGYYSGSIRPVPTMDIERVYFRNDPIILGAPPGKPPNDYSYMRALLKSAMIQDELVKIGLRDVRGVWSHETVRRPAPDRRVDQAALLRSFTPGRVPHRSVPGGGLHEPLRHRGRR